MALTRNGRSIFQNPGSFAGSIKNQNGNWIKGGLRNRFVGGVSKIFGAWPSGHLAPSAFILPQSSGAISSTTYATSSISYNVGLTPAYNLIANGLISITLTNAQLDQIVSAVAAATGTMAASSAALAAAAGMSANADGTITLTNAQLGAIFSVLATANIQASGTGSNLTALANMEAEAGGPTPLSPEALANSVLDALLADHTDPGSVGEALNSIGAAGNPWSADLSSNNTAGTFGAHVQKLLTLAKFLGLK